jgi:hypothetical protein
MSRTKTILIVKERIVERHTCFALRPPPTPTQNLLLSLNYASFDSPKEVKTFFSLLSSGTPAAWNNYKYSEATPIPCPEFVTKPQLRFM